LSTVATRRWIPTAALRVAKCAGNAQHFGDRGRSPSHGARRNVLPW
jgi:hypothetical protein